MVGQNIAQQLEKKVNYRRAVKKSIQATMSMGAEGIRVCVSGRSIWEVMRINIFSSICLF